MIKERPKEYCQFCGKDFTHKMFSEKTHHSNKCDYHNTEVGARRMLEATTKEEKLYEFFNTVGLEINHHSYDEIVSIYDCVIGMYGRGDCDRRYPELVKYMKSNFDEIKKKYNLDVNKEIDTVNREAKEKVTFLRSKLI